MQSLAAGPLQLRQLASQLVQTASESEYEPTVHAATQAVPSLWGLLAEQLTQSVELPPEQVPQST
jgi:hypothetical protein